MLDTKSHSAELDAIILYPASLSKILSTNNNYCFIKNYRNNSSMLILLQFKTAFVSCFFSELHKCFQLALLLAILGKTGM